MSGAGPREAAMGRVPGRYIVFGLVAAAALFFGGLLAWAKWLAPAANRFHGADPPGVGR